MGVRFFCEAMYGEGGIFLLDSPKGLDNVRVLIKSQGACVCVCLEGGGGWWFFLTMERVPQQKKEKKLGRRIR